MPNFSRTVTITSDIDSAFGFLSDFRNLEKWAEGDEGELITKEPLRQGSVFKVRTHFNNKPREYNYEIIEWGPPLRVSLQASTSIFTIVDTIFLSANSRGTEVTYSVDIKYNFPFFVLGIFIGPIFNKLMDKQIKNLEAVLGPVQD